MPDQSVFLQVFWISLKMWSAQFIGPIRERLFSLKCLYEPLIALICWIYRKPAGKMSRYRIRGVLTRDRIGRDRLAVLCVIAAKEFSILNHGTCAVNFASRNSLSVQNPLTTRGNLVVNDYFVIFCKFSLKKSRHFLHASSPQLPKRKIFSSWCLRLGSNQRPPPYEGVALDYHTSAHRQAKINMAGSRSLSAAECSFQRGIKKAARGYDGSWRLRWDSNPR